MARPALRPTFSDNLPLGQPGQERKKGAHLRVRGPGTGRRRQAVHTRCLQSAASISSRLRRSRSATFKMLCKAFRVSHSCTRTWSVISGSFSPNSPPPSPTGAPHGPASMATRATATQRRSKGRSKRKKQKQRPSAPSHSQPADRPPWRQSCCE